MRIVRAKNLSKKFFSSFFWEDTKKVREILSTIKEKGDRAVYHYTKIYDGVRLERIQVNPDEIKKAGETLSASLKSAIDVTRRNIRKFAEKQLAQFHDFELEVERGVYCGQRIMPVERIGVYVPGKHFPLFSSLLMAVLPAQVAGVKEIAVCTPPSYQGSVHPFILGMARILNINEIYQIGGIQAIGAMAYGTETVRKVDKIIGPGNRFVALAKKEVFGAVGIDLLAGPSEVFIVADESANPSFLAADLMAQAEHDAETNPVLITDSEKLAKKVLGEIKFQLSRLPVSVVAKKALKNKGLVILVENLEQAASICNRKAPEHVELQVRDGNSFSRKFRHFGSLFLGENAPEVLGGYSSGLNHILPTGSCGRFTSGLSVRDFIKLQTTLRVTSQGIRRIGPAARVMAQSEGLIGHASAINLRLSSTRKYK